MHPLDEAEIALKQAARVFTDKGLQYATGEADTDSRWQRLKLAARQYGETFAHYVAPPDEKKPPVVPSVKP